jgi:sugar phosphate isomerase/epimerase
MQEVKMKQQEHMTQDPAGYIAAKALVSDTVPLEVMLRIARDAGAEGFEMRRELLPSPLQFDEIRSLCTQLEMFPSPPVYSLACPLFAGRRFEQEPLFEALSLACSFECRLLVTFFPGTLERDERELTALRAVLSTWRREVPGLAVSIENDQSAASSDLATWVRFFEQVVALECPIKMTFDLGNWICLGGDPVEAARALGRYVVYVHATSVKEQHEQCVSLPIRAASARHLALASLPGDAPRVIGFPMLATNDDTLSSNLMHIYDMASFWLLCSLVARESARSLAMISQTKSDRSYSRPTHMSVSYQEGR